MPSRDLRIVVTGGGTGGHTLPAIATVAEIRRLISKHYVDVGLQLLYIGSSNGLEARLAKEAGIEFVPIATGKLRRSANPIRLLSLRNIRDAANVPIGFFEALKVVGAFHPNVIFSTGGYVSVPPVLAGRLLNIPIVMHEQTVQVGLANRISARISSRIALSYLESENELSANDRKKCFITGGIVRPEVTSGDADAARATFGLPGGLPVVYVTGGAQGSSVINRAVRDALPDLIGSCCIIHQCGKQKGPVQDENLLKSAADLLPNELKIRYAVRSYIGEEIGDVYALADLVVGRSGAGTVSEVCAVGKAALFIPLVPTGGDEQTRNAQRLEQLGAAVILKQSDLTGQVLTNKVLDLLSNPVNLRAMGDAARAEYRPEAAKTLANAVISMGLHQSGTTTIQ
jgi:UDP-N-acetylglucosamine--N-acetylmuramyl-(pentapeptide) pyrophosphoryl-undecaprenol N-acetylglucosamine transferase